MTSPVTPAIPAATLVLGSRLLRSINRTGAERLAQLTHRISVLEASPLFAALTRPGIEQLAAAATESDVAAGAIVVSQGEEADAVYLIVDGTVEVTAHGRAPGDVIVADLGPGEYFGEIGLLEGAPRNATCQATTASRLYRIDGEAFLSAVHQAPQTGFLDRARHRAAQTHHLVES